MIESNGKNEYTFLDFSFSPALKQQTNSQVNNNITARNEFLFSYILPSESYFLIRTPFPPLTLSFPSEPARITINRFHQFERKNHYN